MIKWKLLCKLFGCIYPLKKIVLPDHLRIPFGNDVEAFEADISKLCARCEEKL